MNEKQKKTYEQIVAARPEVQFETALVDKKLLMTSPGWPTIVIGKSGGVDLAEVKSYTCSPIEAAIKGDQLLAKQTARQEKKAAANKPANGAA